MNKNMYKTYNPRKSSKKQLPEYGLGDWLKQNAGTIGTVTGTALGAGLGSFAGPAGATIGASIGGQFGGAAGGLITQDYQNGLNEEQAKLQAEKMAYQNKLNLANTQFQQNQARNTGTNSFQNGGTIPNNQSSNPNIVAARQALKNQSNDGGVAYRYSVTPTDGAPISLFRANSAIIRDTLNFAPTGRYTSEGTGPGSAPIYYSTNPEMDYEYKTNKLGLKQSDSGKLHSPNPEMIEWLQNPPSLAEFKQSSDNDEKLKEHIKLSKPNLRNGGLLSYNGQTHDGPNGGIEVDANGSPSSITKQKPVGLVEDGEVSHKFRDGRTYIFSNKLTI